MIQNNRPCIVFLSFDAYGHPTQTRTYIQQNSKRNLSRAPGAAGAFALAPKYRVSATTAEHDDVALLSPPSCLEMLGQEGGAGAMPRPLSLPLELEEQLTELFSMALSGCTAAPPVAERHAHEPALAPLAQAGLLYRPCNGMVCEGRCDTENCTEICLELWQHKCVHAVHAVL